MYHEIKIQVSYATAIVDGRKNFEVRLNDRGYNAGDKIQFRVYDELFHKPEHPLEGRIYNITYVYSGVGLNKDYVVFGIEPMKGGII